MKMIFFKQIFSKPDAKTDVKRSHILQLIIGLVAIIFINVVGYYVFGRLDLTAEKRYTISKSSKHFLKGLKDVVFIRCYLTGDIPIEYKRLSNETREMISQFRSYNSNIEFEFQDPENFKDPAEKDQFYQRLFEKGFQPILVQSDQKDKQVRQYMFPYLEITYHAQTKIVPLLSQKGNSKEDMINASIQNLEYNIYSAMRSLTTPYKDAVAFLRGHGELSLYEMQGFIEGTRDFYNLDTVSINERLNALTDRKYDSINPTNIKFTNRYKAVIIAKPIGLFSYRDLYILDQFIMHGGRVLWLVDPLLCSMDSLQSQPQTYAISNHTGVEDPLFHYGVRLNTNLVLDLQCANIPIKTGDFGDNNPQMSFYPWPFFPVVSSNQNSVISNKINPVRLQFASTIDTIQHSQVADITKIPILTSSANSRIMNTPAIVSLDFLKARQDARLYNLSYLPIAYLLEGRFYSAFHNRLAPTMNNPLMAYKDRCDTANRMIVVADGDIIKNDFVNGEALPLGYDKFEGKMYGNRDFLINCLNYLCGDEDMIPLRSREVIMRNLDTVKVDRERAFWQLFNVGLPILIVLIAAFIAAFFRKKEYTHSFNVAQSTHNPFRIRRKK